MKYFYMQDILEGQTRGLHWRECAFESGSKENVRVWAGFSLVQLMVIGSNMFDMAQDRDRWRAVVSAVMNFRFSQNAGNFLTS
jgi:hypothetical protein